MTYNVSGYKDQNSTNYIKVLLPVLFLESSKIFFLLA